MTKASDTANILKQPFTNTLGTSNYRAGVNAGDTIASGGNYNVVVGDEAGTALTTGDSNVAIGFEALATEDANGLNVAVGYRALKTLNASGAAYNTAVGYDAGTAITTSQYNTIVGGLAADALTTGNENTALGVGALGTETAGDRNVAVGNGALTTQNTTGGGDIYNTAVGYYAGAAVTTGTGVTLIGGLSGDALTTGGSNVAVGYQSLSAETGGTANVAVGKGTLAAQNVNNTAYNTAVGHETGTALTSGVQNTLIGAIAGDALTDADYNTVLGYSALSADTKGSRSVAIGYSALLNQNFTSSTDVNNVAIGFEAGKAITDGCLNGTFIGYQAGKSNTGNKNQFFGAGAGSEVTGGGQNVILGRYNGNQDNLDIRTSSNNIVLSDGDGNVQLAIQSAGCVTIGDQKTPFSTDATLNVDQLGSGFPILCHRDGTGDGVQISFRNDNGQVGRINTSGSATSYVTSSDYRLKENVVDMTGAIDRVKQLLPKRFNFIIDADKTVDGFLAHEVTAVPEAISGEKDAVDADGNIEAQGIDQSKLVPLLTGALKEAIAKIEALETRVATLEG